MVRTLRKAQTTAMDIQRRVSIHLVWGYQKHPEIGLEEWVACMQEKLAGKGLGSGGSTTRKPRSV